MGKEFQKCALSTLFHFLRVMAAFQPLVGVVVSEVSLKRVFPIITKLREKMVKKSFKFKMWFTYYSIYEHILSKIHLQKKNYLPKIYFTF